MVLSLFPVLPLLAPPVRGPPDKIEPLIQIDAGHAHLGERELIRAVVEPAVGKLIRVHHTALQACDALDHLIGGGFALAA